MTRTDAKIRIPAVHAPALLRTPGAVVIDLRSPAEFAVDHVPGARSVPLFDDVERAVIGTLYARRSPEAAFEEGLQRTRERVAGLVEEIAAAGAWSAPPVDLAERVDELCAEGIQGLEGRLDVAPDKDLPPDAVVLSCWRGGLRSRSVVALLRGLGLERAVLLAGGYKAYRADVRAQIDRWQAPPAFVLRGLTGVGKTLVLREIERLRPGWTIDLEGLAGHRSSILGMVGLEPVSQKAFESALAARIREGFPGGVSVFEGESRKVGDIVLPEPVWRTLVGGTSIELVASLERRVQVLIDDYLEHPENRRELARQLPFLEERMGRRKWGGVLLGLLGERRDRELVEVLLGEYYDPLYRHSEGRHTYRHRVDAEDGRAAAEAVIDWVEGQAG